MASYENTTKPTEVSVDEFIAHDSGHSGDAFAAWFSPRKTSLSLYGLTMQPEAPELLGKLGKHKLGTACLYVNKLADVDLDVLEELVRTGLPLRDRGARPAPFCGVIPGTGSGCRKGPPTRIAVARWSHGQ